jgi:hypothetical protein
LCYYATIYSILFTRCSDARMDDVSAKFNNGILSIEIPKVEYLKKEVVVSSSDW